MNISCSDEEWNDSLGMITEGYRDSALWVPRPGVHMVSPQMDHHKYYHRTVLGEYCYLEMEE